MTVTASAWSDGYIVDVAYHEPIIGDLCPAILSTSLVLHGQPPLDRTRTLSWIELGCGNGTTACMVGAANANVEVWGCDFNPAHVERARGLAAKAQLTNCAFDEVSFADLAAGAQVGPVEADVIIVNGVYSWISHENQLHIAQIVRQRLRPGGVVFVSYGLQTGWSAMTPIAEAIHLHARDRRRSSDAAYLEAVGELQALAERGARAFPLPPREAEAFTNLGTVDARLGAHEYLGAHFRPVVFSEVADVMGEARCSFVGSVDPTDHLVNLWAPPALQGLLAETHDNATRQLLRDLIVQQPLRRDLFRRGVAPSNSVMREGWLRELVVVGTGQPLPEEATVKVPLGTVTLDAGFYRPLVAALDDGPLDLAAIEAVHDGISFDDAVAALALLVGGGYATPTVRGWEGSGTVDSARRLNLTLIAENRTGGDHDWLAVPATGGAIATEHVEMLTIGALLDGTPPDVEVLSRHALTALTRQGRLVRENDELIDDDDEALRIVRSRVSATLQRANQRLGALGITQMAARTTDDESVDLDGNQSSTASAASE